MLYTVMPMEVIYESYDENNYAYEEIGLKNCTLQVYAQDKHYVVKSVISTDPAVFLNQAYQPGRCMTHLELAKLKNDNANKST